MRTPGRSSRKGCISQAPRQRLPSTHGRVSETQRTLHSRMLLARVTKTALTTTPLPTASERDVFLSCTVPPEDVVACVEQALGMLHTLRPAVQLTLQLQEVLLPGDGDEGRHPTDHTAVLEPLADPALPPLQRLHAGALFYCALMQVELQHKTTTPVLLPHSLGLAMLKLDLMHVFVLPPSC